VAATALGLRGHVVARNRSRPHARVATSARCPCDQVGVLYPLRVERDGGVTSIAVVVTRNVADDFTFRHDTVVTTETSAAHGRVIDSDYRQEIVEGVAEFAVIQC
jgi:hypothetical protein